MKHKLAFAIVAVLLLAGCKNGNIEDNNGPTCKDSVVAVNWVYKNSTDRDIQIESYYQNDNDKNGYKMDLSFSISNGSEYVITKLDAFGITAPFQWDKFSKNRYLLISDGEKQLKEWYYSDTLYCPSLYTCISNPNNEHEVYYTYTFTDEDFKDAKPIEQ